MIAAARGIIAHDRKDMLSEFGGSLIPTKKCASCRLDIKSINMPVIWMFFVLLGLYSYTLVGDEVCSSELTDIRACNFTRCLIGNNLLFELSAWRLAE